MPYGKNPSALFIVDTYLHPKIDPRDINPNNHKLLDDAEIDRMKQLFHGEGRFGKKDFPEHHLKYSFLHFGSNYYVEYKKIGAGKSNTVVRLVQDVDTKKMVVVKKAVYDEFDADIELECLQRVKQAIKANKKPIHLVKKDNDIVREGVMMKLARGYNLYEISEHVSLPLVRIIKLFLDLIMQLEKIHKNGIIHTDIKELNIIYDIFRSKVTIIDFDLAILTQDGKGIDDFARGTEGYKAPEAYDGKFCFKTDYFSLGVVFHNMVSLYCKGKRKKTLVSFINEMLKHEAELRPSYMHAKKFFSDILSNLGDEERNVNVALLDMNEYLTCKKNTDLYGKLISELRKYHEVWIVDEKLRKKIKYVLVQRELFEYGLIVNYDVFTGLPNNELIEEMSRFMHDKQGDIRYHFTLIHNIGCGIGDKNVTGLRTHELSGKFFLSYSPVAAIDFNEEETSFLIKKMK